MFAGTCKKDDKTRVKCLLLKFQHLIKPNKKKQHPHIDSVCTPIKWNLHNYTDIRTHIHKTLNAQIGQSDSSLFFFKIVWFVCLTCFRKRYSIGKHPSKSHRFLVCDIAPAEVVEPGRANGRSILFITPHIWGRKSSIVFFRSFMLHTLKV